MTDESPVLALFSPWTQLLQRGSASCSVRNARGRDLVARVDVDLFTLLDDQDADSVARTVESLRELLELLQLAFHADARTLRVLVASGLIRDGYGDFLPRHGVEPTAIEVVLCMVKFSLDAYVPLERLGEFLAVKTRPRSGEYKQARRALGVSFPWTLEAHRCPKLTVRLHAVSPVMNDSDRQRRRDKAAEFFQYVDDIASYAGGQEDRLSGPQDELESDHLASLDTSVRLLVRPFPLTPAMVETVRDLMHKHHRVVVCRFVTLHPREIECSMADVCEFVEACVRSCPEATVQLGEELPAAYRNVADVETAWQTQIDSILGAVVAVKAPFQTLDIGPLASSLSWTVNQEAFWYGMVEKVLEESSLCIPFKQLRYQSTLGGLSEDEAVFIRSARRRMDPDRKRVSLERISVGEVEEPSEEGIKELLRLVGGPSVKELVISTFGDGGSPSPLQVLQMFPGVEELTLGTAAVSSMHVFTQFFENQDSCALRKLALRDLTIRDSASIAEFLGDLCYERFKLSKCLEVLRFDQQTWDIRGNFAFDETMVNTLEQLLQSNRRLREVAIIVREHVSTEARERLLSHIDDVVRPPHEVRDDDLRSRLAFFSVVDHVGTASPLGKMDALVQRRIFEFSATHWTRQISLADEMADENEEFDEEEEFDFD